VENVPLVEGLRSAAVEKASLAECKEKGCDILDPKRKKELTMQYKQTKPPMGLFMIRSKTNNKYYLEGTQDLRGKMNGALVRLSGGMHPNRELQKEWSELGRDNFTAEILETLEYDKDESKTDYTDDLKLMQMICEEKFAAEGLAAYKKRI
jgi:hypothetical protein